MCQAFLGKEALQIDFLRIAQKGKTRRRNDRFALPSRLSEKPFILSVFVKNSLSP
jgi:hypothetical protein